MDTFEREYFDEMKDTIEENKEMLQKIMDHLKISQEETDDLLDDDGELITE